MSNIRNKIIIGFSVIILLLSTIGIYLIHSMQNMAKEASNIYNHPFTVSNAAKDIKINLLNIQNSVKEGVIKKDSSSEPLAIDMLRNNERLILEKFEIIRDRYLGEPEDVETAFTFFRNWLRIIDQVVLLQKERNFDSASALITNEAEEEVNRLTASLRALSDFASGKANEFYDKTLQGKRDSFLVLSILLLTCIGFSILILIRVVNNHDFTLREINRYLHLVDQNILIASMDTNGKITEISNALCRFLGLSRDQLLGTKCNFFLGDDQYETVDSIYKVINTGSEWQGDLERINKNGETQYINLSIHPVFDDSFNISSFNHIVQDVTDKKTLEQMSITDKLTMLNNRGHFDEIIEREIKLAHRNNSYLALAIADIDHFKMYNDNYGHPAGDEVLINVASVFKTILNRTNDFIFRLGGEEFGIIFSATDKEATERFLENIRKEIESLHIEHKFSSVADHITISIGARVVKGRGVPHKNQFYIQADQALYQAKKKRNRVCITAPESSG